MEADWRPSTPLRALRARARILSQIRAFFAARDVMEVETPILSAAATPDPHIESLATRYSGPDAPSGGCLYLQTSPEYPMKRLLAAGSGAIFQLARVFRDGEAGRLHNPEFTLLEWYRPGFTLEALMDEVADLVRAVLDRELPVRRVTYGEAFRRALGLDPHRAALAELRRAAAGLGVATDLGQGRDDWLNLLLSHRVESTFDSEVLTFLHDYPASQAALARLRPGDPPVAARFELYFGGMELANGFHELADADEQARRFEEENRERRVAGRPEVPLDRYLLDAIDAGLPDCSGVALGVDRLVMCAIGARCIDEVIAFPVQRA